MENMIPCKPFAIILVFRPRPKRPRRPSWRTTSLAASAVRVSYQSHSKSDCRGGPALTVRHLRLVDLAVCLDHPQGVGHRVRHDGGAEANEGQAGQPDNERVLRGLGEGLGEEVIL